MTKYIISRLKVLEDYKPTIKSKFNIFYSIEKDDILEIKIEIERTGKYAMIATFTNTTKSKSLTCYIGKIFDHLKSINYINQ